MGIYLGNTAISGFKIGDTAIKKGYLGSTLLFGVNYLPASLETIKNLRITAGGTRIGTGDARIDSIRGNSLAWNQLVGTASTVDTIRGRKYYTKIGGVESIITGDGTALSVTPGSDMVTDLTLLFGGTVPTGFSVSDFKALFPLALYDYQAGVIKNVSCARTKQVMWNQLISPSMFPSSLTNNQVTFTNNNDGSITINGTASGDAFFIATIKPSVINGHKYIFLGETAGGARINTFDTNSWPGSTGKNAPIILTAQASGTLGYNGFRIFVPSGSVCNNEKIWPMFIDLTLIYGAGNEPSTVEEFQELFPGYYPYNAGEVKTLTLEQGGIRSTGTDSSVYDLSIPITTKTAKLNGQGASVIPFPEGLKGVGDVYDIATRTGAPKKFGIIDLGTLGWNGITTSQSGKKRFNSVPIPGIKNSTRNFRCSTLIYGSTYNCVNGSIMVDGTSLLVYLDAFSALTGEQFKSAISGVLLVYELDTPEEYIWDTPLNVDYFTEDGGTEQLIPADSADEPLIPLPAEIKYIEPE